MNVNYYFVCVVIVTTTNLLHLMLLLVLLLMWMLVEKVKHSAIGTATVWCHLEKVKRLLLSDENANHLDDVCVFLMVFCISVIFKT